MSASVLTAGGVAAAWIATYAALVVRAGRWPRARSACFAVGIVLLAGSATLSDHLLASHMAAHVALIWAGGLLAAGLPLTLVARALPELRAPIGAWLSGPIGRALARGPLAAGGFILAAWAFHFGPLFSLSLEHPGLHLLEHGLLLATAAALWLPLIPGVPLPARRDGFEHALWALLALAATEPIGALYMARGDRTAGLVMIAGTAPLALAVLAAAWRALVREERRNVVFGRAGGV